MDHPNKKIFLSGIREEFNISFPAMMTDHGKTCNLIGCTGIRLYLDKSPVHLIGFPGDSLISASPVPLRGNDLTFGWNKITVISDISFYGCQSAGISGFLQSLKAYRRIRDAFSEQSVNKCRYIRSEW